MGIRKKLSRTSYFALFVVYFLSFLTFFVLPASKVYAFTSAEINAGVSSLKFADTMASVITMQVAGQTLSFKRLPNPPAVNGSAPVLGEQYVYELQSNTACKTGNVTGSIVPRVANIKISPADLDVASPPANIKASLELFAENGSACNTQGVNGSVQVTNSFRATLKVPDAEKAAVATVGSEGGGTAEDVNTCDAKLTSPITWIICPVIELGVGATDKIFSDFIQPLMEDVPVSTNSDDGAYKAWQQFRLIGNIVLVGAMIAVVYAQIKGS